MRGGPTLERCLAVGYLVASLPACSKLAGIDEYEVSAQPDATIALGLIENRPECRACFETQCSAELEACQGTPACAAAIECLRGCSDPSCATACRSLGAAQRNYNLPYVYLYDCARARCEEACPLGTNFDCVGRYELPAPYVGRQRIALNLDVEILPNVVADGITAHECPAGAIGCKPDGVSAPVLGRRVTLNLAPTNPKGFQGSIYFSDDRIDAGSSDGGISEGPLLAGYLISTMPFREDYVSYIGIPTHAYCDLLMSAAGTACDLTRAYVYVLPSDCDGLAARDVELELSGADPRMLRNYFANTFEVSTTLQKTVGYGAIFSLVPAGVAAQLVARYHGTEVSQATVIPPAGSFTRVHLRPTPAQ
jgi:hypothetical protein